MYVILLVIMLVGLLVLLEIVVIVRIQSIMNKDRSVVHIVARHIFNMPVNKFMVLVLKRRKLGTRLI